MRRRFVHVSAATPKLVNRLQLQCRNAAHRADTCLALEADGLQRNAGRRAESTHVPMACAVWAWKTHCRLVREVMTYC